MKSVTVLRPEADQTISVTEIAAGREPSITRTATGRYEETPDGAFSISLPDGLSESRHVFLDLPSSFLSLRIIPMPLEDPAKIRRLLPVEAEGRFQSPVSDLVLDYLPLPPGDEGHRVLLSAASLDRLSALIDALSGAGMEPRVVGSLDLTARAREAELSVDHLMEPPAMDDSERLSLAITEMKNPGMNFRHGPLKYTAHQKEAVRLVRWTAPLGALFLVLLIANWGLRYHALSSDIKDIKSREADVFAMAFPSGGKMVDTAYQIKAKSFEVKKKLQTLSGVDPLSVIQSLAQMKGEPTDIVLSEVRITEDSAIVKGEGATFKMMNDFAEKLRAVFDDVTVSDSSSSAAGGVRFSLQINFASSWEQGK